MTLKEQIVAELDDLPEQHLRRVFDLVEFLKWKAPEPDSLLLSVAGILSGGPLSAVEIEQELYGEKAVAP